MEQGYEAEMQQALMDIIGKGKLTDKTIFIFGHCNAAEEIVDYLAKHSFVTEAILDNNTAKQGMIYGSVPIVTPSHISEYKSERSVVLIASRYFDQMTAQLRHLQYNGEILKVVDYNTFAEYSLQEEILAQKKARLYRGANTMETIRKKYPIQHLVVCPYNALGDTYWAVAFLAHYLHKKAIKEVAVVVTGDGCGQVARMFGVTNLIVLASKDMDELVQALIFTCERNHIIAHHDRPYTDNSIRWLNKYFLSFIDFYRCAVYGLPKETLAAHPTHLQPCAELPIPQGNTVIMAPYAKSIGQLPDEFWIHLAKKYQRDGYCVCTSVNRDEAPIAGTIPLHIPLGQIISAAEYAGCFIGRRSGLCDIIHTARCRKVVIFPDCFYSTTPHKVADFFALPGCLTQNTPVLLTVPDEEKIGANDIHSRLKDFFPLLHHNCYADFLCGNVDYDILNPPENSGSYIVYRDNQMARCTDFIAQCEKGGTVNRYPCAEGSAQNEYALVLHNKIFQLKTVVDTKNNQLQNQRTEILALQRWLRKYETFNEWKNVEYFGDWETRSSTMSTYIHCACTSLLDLGCGEMHIKKYLPPNIKYYGCDYIKRDADTIVCDLAVGEFPEISVDTIFIAGLLEYLDNWKSVLEKCSQCCRQMVMSYSTTDSAAIRDPIWVTEISRQKLLDFVCSLGFHLSASAQISRCEIFDFRKAKKRGHVDVTETAN